MANDPATESGEALSLPPTVPETVPAPEQPETKEPEETKEEETVEPEEKPRSGYARQKLRHQRLISQYEAQLAENEALKQKLAQYQSAGSTEKPLKAPRMQDFTDMEAYDEAVRNYNLEQTKRVVAEQLAESEKRQSQSKQQENQAEVLDDFFERWNELEKQMPDAKESVDRLYASIGPLTPVVRDLIADADNGEVILYYIAKNPGIGRQLNNVDAITAAKMIGQLEEKTKLPLPRKETGAPPVISAPKGGAAPPKDIFQTAKKDDVSDYIKMRLAMEKK